MSWKPLFGSVVGSSHIADGTPCQDACEVVCHIDDGVGCFVAVCADGAGSARYGKEGAELVVRSLIESCCRPIFMKAPLVEVEFEFVEILKSTKLQIAKLAEENGAEIRDYACTMLLAVQRARDLVFVQLGDGAIVIERAGVCGVVTWPMGGEYAGTTYFVTETNAIDLIEFTAIPGQISRLLMFTDGLERLALNFANQLPHLPFAQSLWEQLESAESPSDLMEPMFQFLNSPQVVSRTDDDKTLVVIVKG